jgi:hypothetical protein
MIKNTSYKVQADVDSEEVRLQYQIEEGAYVTTSSGVWTVYNGEWVKLYPHSAAGSGLGWTRYDDGQYTSENKLTVTSGTKVVLPNNGATVYRSYSGIDYYNSTTQKVLGSAVNDLYLATIVFKASTTNAEQGYFHIVLENTEGTPYERLHEEFTFPKGNNVTHDIHAMFQYYVDADFIANGSQWEIAATNRNVQVWDIIFFFSKIQSYA